MGAAQQVTSITGTALAVAGDDIDTDRIIPARYLRAITFEGMEQHVFEDDRKAMGAGRASGPGAAPGVHPFDDPRFTGASILLVNRNFGCGSSREHAPQAIQRWGIQAIVGESFSDIFAGNSGVIGLPLVTAAPGDIRKLMACVDQRPDTQVRGDLSTIQ